MSNKYLDAIAKELHPQAMKVARDYINDFAVSLILQSKVTALNAKADLVLSSHVDEALRTIVESRKQNWTREIIIVIGGAFFGTFVQGFISELSTGNIFLIVTYTILGFVGMFMIFWGLRR